MAQISWCWCIQNIERLEYDNQMKNKEMVSVLEKVLLGWLQN